MKHDWTNGDRDGSTSGKICLACGAPQTLSNADEECRGRQPRSIPPSIFGDLGAIGDAMREIQAREDPYKGYRES